jgi:hypothetical protein
MASRKSSTRRRRSSAGKRAASKRVAAGKKRRPKPAAKGAKFRKSHAKVRPATSKKAPAKPAAARRSKRFQDSADDPRWLAPVWDDAHLLGAHVSIAGGTHHAPRRARAIGATAMQMFTKMASRWAERTCADEESSSFRGALDETRVGATIAHDSYLINLASPDAALRRRSIESFVGELARCEALGIEFLVSHPGNYIDDRASGVQRNADAIAEDRRVHGNDRRNRHGARSVVRGVGGVDKRHPAITADPHGRVRRYVPRVFRGLRPGGSV